MTCLSTPSQPSLSIPDGSYLHTVAVEVDEAVKYATFAFGQWLLLTSSLVGACRQLNGGHVFTMYRASIDVADSLKVKCNQEEAKDLSYSGLKIVSVDWIDCYFNASSGTVPTDWFCTVPVFIVLFQGGCCWEVGTWFHWPNLGQ